MKQKINNLQPVAAASAYVHERAVLIGNVVVGEGASVWPNAVLRADIAAINIGAGSNVQDNVSIHVDYDKPALIGKNVTIGHNVVVHGAKIGDNTLIGMGAIVMECEIGPDCIIGAGALVPAGKIIPAGSLLMGVPAKVVRVLSAEERKSLCEHAQEYIRLAAAFKTGAQEV
ncbi:MAG: gamma carbonic anhydrase family protein [Elusimicrobiota bacterium]|jgi:carbonic anhydrase/acetyltransferase-like protein (isoleucine patch superfamily)|nr:gamma carbonic anhydrase family protein [Elusimicrobiota bacterium]